MKTELIWITPDAEKMIAYIARVSNPDNQENPSYAGLLKYCVEHKHWSPFEMASACFEIETTRDIARQILRHRSFSFQEFSQRYATTMLLPKTDLREARLQDTKNRQNSIPSSDAELAAWWANQQQTIINASLHGYNEALDRGIAKEQARALLPEGLTNTRMYMSGTIRSWMHYCELRAGNGTQKEHADIAISIREQLRAHLPNIFTEAK